MLTHWRFAAWVWRFGSCRHLHVHVRGLRRARLRNMRKDAQIEAMAALVLLVSVACALCSL